MPTLSIYVNDKIYKHLMDKGNPSSIAAAWIKERFEKETNGELK